jgi:pimeloyl-ACP methyl ester carboxylesterase
MNRRLSPLLLLCTLALAACQSAPPSSSAVKRMEVNGVQLAYVDQGSGAPVLFVHPALADMRVWDGMRDSFAKSYRFVAYDQRYFGRDTWPDKGERFSRETQVSDLVAFIRGLNSGPVHLVGWSMSAETVLLVAMRNPELVRSVFSYEPGGIEILDAAKAKQVGDDAGVAFGPVVAAVKTGDETASARALIDNVENKPGSYDAASQTTRVVWKDNARTMAPMFSSPPILMKCQQLEQIRVPVAMAKGELTRPFFSLSTDAAAGCIRGARLVVGAGQRHIWPAADPASFENAVKDFLRSQ